MVEADALPPLPSTAGPEARAAQYASVLERLALLLEGEKTGHSIMQWFDSFAVEDDPSRLPTTVT